LGDLKDTSKDPVVHVELSMPTMDLKKRLLDCGFVGQGGMSVIDEVRDLNLARSVARKVIRPEKMDDEAACGYLVEEAQITAQLDHPNIVPVHELGIDDQGHLFFTMKLVRGKTFSKVISEKEFTDLTKKEFFDQLQIFIKVCDAVAFAHHRGVIHRDLKPDNIMVGDYGEVYLMDWGLAKLKEKWRPSQKDREMPATAPTTPDRKKYVLPSEDGRVRATLSYMAPEQALGNVESIDERTDVFCLGGILYEILTGRPPYRDPVWQKMIFAAVEGRISSPCDVVDFSLPARLCEITMKALSKNPDDRYQSVAQLKEDVEGFIQSGWQFQRRVFPAGSLIVREGDVGDEAYIITKGRCRAFRMVAGKKSVLQEMSDGDVFGEIAVFAKQPRGATVEAIDQVSAMVVTRKHFEEDLGMNAWLGLFVKALAERLLKTTDRATELELKIKRAGL
jgi:serine/threonine protein kinase